MGRFVPFLAVATANCINIPMMRQGEIVRGVIVMDNDGNQLGESRVRQTLLCLLLEHTVLYFLQKAATKGIAQVCLSRITMSFPGMSEFLSH